METVLRFANWSFITLWREGDNMKSALTRRQFIKQTALVTSVTAFPAIIPSSVLGETAPSKTITLGHIGMGERGHDLMTGFLGLNHCRIVAVSDCYKSRREEGVRRANAQYNSNSCKSYADFRELCADPSIDAVVVATPDHWHVLAALEAVRHGKHVYVEKPLGYSIEQDKVLRQAVHSYGVVFQYGTQQRSMEHMRWTCEMVINGRLGKLKAIEIRSPGNIQGGSTTPVPIPEDLDYDRFLGPSPYEPYTSDRCTFNGSWHISHFSLGFVGGWGAHPLDIMLWGLGDTPDAVPVEYYGSATYPMQGLYDTPLGWDVRGKFTDGKDFLFTAPSEDLTLFTGEKGRIGVKRAGFEVIDPPSLKDAILEPGEKRLVVSMNHGENFIDAIRTGSPTVTNVSSASYSDFICHLSDIAMRSGRKIRWNSLRETIIDDPYAARMMHKPLREPWSLG